MNENVLSFIKWAAGIVITLTIISIALLIFNMARNGAVEGANKIQDMNKQIAESDLTMYDGQVVAGSAVINLIRRCEDEYLGIRVITGKSTTWYGYTCTFPSGGTEVGSKSGNTISNAIDEKNNNYINQYGNFLGSIHRDANGSIVAISFEQKKD